MLGQYKYCIQCDYVMNFKKYQNIWDEKLYTIILVYVAFVGVSDTHTMEIQLTFSRLPDEQKLMFEYFHGITQDFYVDIGAFHPVDRSNTRILKNMGWKGINVDGNYQRIKLFYGMNNEDLNLNYAIGKQEDQYVQLFINTQIPSLSTGSKNVVRGSGFNKNVNTPTISLAQLCQRYFIKKPVFLNLDVEGFGGFAVRQNNWKEQKCRPDIILAQQNQWNELANSGSIRDYLQQRGYEYITHVGEDSFYIEKQKVKFYEENAEKNRKLMADGDIILFTYNETASKIKSYLPKGNNINGISYNVFTDPVYVHFAVKGDSLNLDYLCQYSNKIAEHQKLKGRPIVIYNYDPRDTIIILTENYNLTELDLKNGHKYYVLRFQKQSFAYQVYIFNHAAVPKQQLLILSPKISRSPQVPVQQQKISHEQVQQIRKQPINAQKQAQNYEQLKKLNRQVADISRQLTKFQKNNNNEVMTNLTNQFNDLGQELTESIQLQIQKGFDDNQTSKTFDLALILLLFVTIICTLYLALAVKKMFKKINSQNLRVESNSTLEIGKY